MSPVFMSKKKKNVESLPEFPLLFLGGRKTSFRTRQPRFFLKNNILSLTNFRPNNWNLWINFQLNGLKNKKRVEKVAVEAFHSVLLLFLTLTWKLPSFPQPAFHSWDEVRSNPSPPPSWFWFFFSWVFG